jgi:glycosidase
MSEIVFLSNVRLSFPHLAEPQKQVNEVNGNTRISYNCEFLMPQDHPGFQQFMARYGALALEKWKENATNVMNMILQDRKIRCFGQGNEKVNKKTFQPYDGYAGNVYITAGRDSAPQMIQADGTAIDPNNTMAYQTLARKMYGGCRVNAAVKPWAQDNKHGRGIRCDLIAVQFAADDTPFGEGAADASNLFGAVQQAAVPGFAASAQPAMPAAPFGLPSFLG